MQHLAVAPNMQHLDVAPNMQHLAVAPIPYSSLTLDQLHIVLEEEYASFKMTPKERREWQKGRGEMDYGTTLRGLREKTFEAMREIEVSWKG
jgi:hypothetical protein